MAGDGELLAMGDGGAGMRRVPDAVVVARLNDGPVSRLSCLACGEEFEMPSSRFDPAGQLDVRCPGCGAKIATWWDRVEVDGVWHLALGTAVSGRVDA